MDMFFYVEGLHIKLVEPCYVVNDSQNYIRAFFSFKGYEWTNDAVKTAYFNYNGQTYSVVLEDNFRCYIPAEVLKGEMFSVGVSTTFTEDGVSKCIYTDRCEIPTEKSCYSDEVSNSQTTLSEYQQILNLISQMRSDINGKVSQSELSNAIGEIDLSDLSDDVALCMGNIQGIGLDITTLQNVCMNIEDDIMSIKARCAMNETDINSLVARMSAVESSMSGFLQFLDSINGQVI